MINNKGKIIRILGNILSIFSVFLKYEKLKLILQTTRIVINGKCIFNKCLIKKISDNFCNSELSVVNYN